MDDDRAGPLTIGQLSRRTGMPVRTIRYWSDIGALPPVGRSGGGYRLYDANSLARLELIRTLRDLGLGLNDVRRVLQRNTTVAAVADAHVKALDAQIRTLRLRRAVLSTVAPEAAEAAELLDRLLGPADSTRRTEVLDRLEAAADAQAERYRQLLAAVNGEPVPSPHAADYAWLAAALGAHP